MSKRKKKGSKGFILFVIFFAIGIFVGVYSTKLYLDKNNNDKEETISIIDNIDITDKSEYQNLINELYGSLKGNSEFYKTSGVNLDTMNNSFKYGLLYDELISSQKYVSETLTTIYYGANVCLNDFLADYVEGYTISNTCTVKKILISDLVDLYKKKFNKEDLDTTSTFYPTDTVKCIVEGEYYVCGDVNALTGVTGTLDTRFSIEKVIKDNKGNVYIYDKGYLIDTRSTVPLIEGVDNYYLHASDLSDYYYELKSADNYTFKHTFILGEDNNYYYSKSELNKK